MNENLDRAEKPIESLSDQKKQLDIALYYTHNDSEKAKDMVSGVYKDIFAIKVKFSISTTYGAFLLFFNIPYCSLINSFAIMSHSYIVDDLKTKSGWRDFEAGMEDISTQSGHDSELTAKMRSDLAQSFTMQSKSNQRAIELRKYLEMNDEIAANRIIQKFIRDKFGFLNINLSVDYERMSSLDMELYSTTSQKIEKELSTANKEGKKEEPEIVVESAEEDDIDIDKKDIQLILNGNLVLSPIKGKNISSVEIGDRVKISLNNSPKAISVAKAFRAYSDGKTLPITGRVVSIRHLSDGGYKLFCLIAKGIYVKIEEEEEDIKVALEVPEDSKEFEKSHTSLIIIIAMAFFVLIAVALIVIKK